MRIIRRLIPAVVIMAAFVPVYAQEEKVQEENFFSETISSVINKVDKVASGQERIVDENAKGIDDNILMYDGNSLGNRQIKRVRPMKPAKRTPLEEKIDPGGQE